MINSYAFGFVAVAAAAVVGADYVLQSKAAGSNPGLYSASEYAANIPVRITAYKDEWALASRQSKLAQEHLPEAPEGWERRAWESDPEAEKAMLKGLTLVDQMAVKKAVRTAKIQARKQMWEYVRGNDVIRLSAHFKPRPEEGDEVDPAIALVAPMVSFDTAGLRAFDVIQGVPVFNLIDPETGRGAGGAGPLYLQAFIGDQVSIGVHAQGSEDAVRELLAQVDFDALNAMLDHPVDGIGSAAPHLTEEQRTALLEATLSTYSQGAPHPSPKPAYDGTVIAASDAAPQVNAEAPQPTGLQDHGVSRMTVGQAKEGTPGRLQLSGGKSCLDGAAGKFCK